MMSKFRVRFVADNKTGRFRDPYADKVYHPPRALDVPNKRRKSKNACLECKNRHLKCDETFPACLRCQQHGINCRSPLRSAQWQIETPELSVAGPLSKIRVKYDHRLLQYWLEKASQIMVIDPNINPLSFDIIKYLESSQSLIHGIQSLSVAHEKFFEASCLQDCLQERGHALTLLQKELKAQNQPLHGTLLTILLLGFASLWVPQNPDDNHGRRHLQGARAVLDILLAKSGSTEDPFIRQSVAIYLCWDQAISFLQPTDEQIPLYTPELFSCVQVMENEYNATVGYLAKIMYLLGNVGRYCRMIVDGCHRNLELEASFEAQLLATETTSCGVAPELVNDSFRKHGLIMLYRSIETAGLNSNCSVTSDDLEMVEPLRRQTLQNYARDILKNIEEIPEDCHYHCILGQPLLTAGAELTHEDSTLREKVREHFRKLFSLNRIPANVQAVEFLREVWKLKDRGEDVFWMTHLLTKKNIFILA